MDIKDVSKNQFIKESQAMAEMVSYLDDFKHDKQILNTAYDMVSKARISDSGLSVEAFLNQYNLSTKEGVALMCLAEALLRIPDKKTVDKLIASTFKDTNWEQYLGDDKSFYFNATSWGMLLTGKVLEFGSGTKEKPANVLKSIFKKTYDPVIRKALGAAMHLIAMQFVMGENIDKALKKAAKFEKDGYRFSYDVLGEGARNKEQSDYYFKAYKEAISKVAKHNSKVTNQDFFAQSSVSIKLTALHPRYELLKKERVYKELLPRIVDLIKFAKDLNVAVSIDAEEARRLDISLEIFREICLMPDFDGYNGIGYVLQAYQKKSFYVIDFLSDLAKKSNRIIPIRLVKGAYWDSEIKHAQINGLAQYPVFTNKYHSDVSYLACARKILDRCDLFYPQFATHNAYSIAAIQAYATGKKYEFQRLYGMGESLYKDIVNDAPCRIYAPIGRHKDLLAYLIRRLLENGANSSFISMLVNDKIAVADVVEDPIARVKENGGRRNPTIALPCEIYGDERLNSKGIDLGNIAQVDEFKDGLEEFSKKEWNFKNNNLSGDAVTIYNPSNISQTAGIITIATAKDATQAVLKAQNAYEIWKNVSVKDRSDILRKAADLLEENIHELSALCIKEAGKVLADVILELREAVDFCRYYAAQAEKIMSDPITLPSVTGELNNLTLHPKGVFVCISPWNFPLAIFVGQVAAALVVGNSVIAKPAEQTPLIASRVTELFYEAGIPKDVLQLLPGEGSILGPELVKQEAVKGVCFTGSTATAKSIQRSLANRDDDIITFIAETGGQNCMIADSSTLLEQLSDDVVLSAFGGAGQRCSALRILFLPESITDEALKIISGAAKELEVGNPINLSTDIGPVIDDKAKKNLEAHIETLEKSSKAKLIAKLKIKSDLLKGETKGNYFAPQIWKIDDLSILKEEHFGPILHIVSYKEKSVKELIKKVNSLKFGLTFGIHTRIHEQYQGIENLINAGNVYINRNITGAVVGSQPFGGEGLSGTGFKAGGPHYLLKFINEKVVTTNVSAIGGNIELLMKS
jgi:RHH-type proline utilization regulon transcriptional repressor/proline dehydrogenase/delta 1-pyrroline-5-carboxylate dehydrogenase